MMHQIHLHFIGIIACILATSRSISPSDQHPFQNNSHGMATMEDKMTTVGIAVTPYGQVSFAEEKPNKLFKAKLEGHEFKGQHIMLLHSKTVFCNTP